MATPPEDDERISQKVVYEHTTSTRQNMGAIIAAIVAALILIAFIVMQISHNPPRRKGSLTPRVENVVAQTLLSVPSPVPTPLPQTQRPAAC